VRARARSSEAITLVCESEWKYHIYYVEVASCERKAWLGPLDSQEIRPRSDLDFQCDFGYFMPHPCTSRTSIRVDKMRIRGKVFEALVRVGNWMPSINRASKNENVSSCLPSSALRWCGGAGC